MQAIKPAREFTSEKCAACDGRGTSPHQKACGPCHGKATILVAQPSASCLSCGGNGKPDRNSIWPADYCVVCLGTGWLMTEFHF